MGLMNEQCLSFGLVVPVVLPGGPTGVLALQIQLAPQWVLRL